MRILFRAVGIAAIPFVGLTAQSVDWPVYQGDDDHTHYTTLGQISPKNVAKLQVAWTYDTKDAFDGSEMQSNAVVVGGVLYAMSPKQRAFCFPEQVPAPLWFNFSLPMRRWEQSSAGTFHFSRPAVAVAAR